MVEGCIGSSKLDLAGLVFRFGFGYLVGLCRTFGWVGDFVGSDILLGFTLGWVGDLLGMEIWLGWTGLGVRLGWRFSYVEDSAGLEL